jgi:hypothetical protein
LILGEHLGQSFARRRIAGFRGKQWNDALAHVPGGFEFSEAFVGGEPLLCNQTHDNPAGARGIPQGLRPFFSPGNITVIDENVGEVMTTQPRLQVRSRGIVLARVTYEKNRHCPSPIHDAKFGGG